LTVRRLLSIIHDSLRRINTERLNGVINMGCNITLFLRVYKEVVHCLNY